jgi:hypothetical protein
MLFTEETYRRFLPRWNNPKTISNFSRLKGFLNSQLKKIRKRKHVVDIIIQVSNIKYKPQVSPNYEIIAKII